MIEDFNREKNSLEERKFPLFSFGVPLKHKIIFLRNLKVMVESGVSIPQALNKIASFTRHKKFKRIIFEISDKVSKGRKLSEALSDYPDVFPKVYYSIIKAGEESGNLSIAINSILTQTEREYELSSNIKGAMIYPAVIILTMIGVGIMMLVFVVPNITKVFEDFGVELPQSTKIVIGLGTFLIERWYITLIVLIFLAIGVKKLVIEKSQKGKGPRLSKIILRIPLISPLVKRILVARFVMLLSVLIKSGVSLVEALSITRDTLDNYYYREALKDAKEKIQKGVKLSKALSPYSDLFIPPTIELISVGEETGKTSEILEGLSLFIEEEVKRSTKNLIAAIEPLIMVMIGGVIGFFAVSMIEPMTSMLQGIK